MPEAPQDYPVRELNEQEKLEISQAVADGSFKDDELRETYKISIMQLAGFKAANKRKNNNGHSDEECPEPQTRGYATSNLPDTREYISKEEVINLLARGCNPKKLSMLSQYDEPTLIAFKAHIDMDTYNKNPELLKDKPKNGKRNGNGPAIQTKEQFVPFVEQNPQARDLSLLALSLGADGHEIEEALMHLYGGKFKSREDLHKLLEETKDEIVKLLEEGVTNLGAFIGGYSLFDRRMAPILLGKAAGSIPIEKATPTLEKMLIRVGAGLYDPMFNENPKSTIGLLTQKRNESRGLAKKIYDSLVQNYEGALAIGEKLKSYATRKIE